MILANLPHLLLFLSAVEEEAPAESPSMLWPMLGIAAIFYFVMIAPERKRKKAREDMVEALKKGDKVMTTSGMHGTITQVQGEVVTLQIADGVRVKFALAAIQGKLDEETPGKEKDKTLTPKGSGNGEEQDSDAKAEAVSNSK